MKLAHLWIQHRTMHLNTTFTYLCEGFDVRPGARVEVSFNRQRIVGFVAKVEETNVSQDEWEQANGYKLISILTVIDNQPVLNDELYDLGLWLSKTTISPVIACFQTMLPKYLNPKNTTRKPVEELWIVPVNDTNLPSKYADIYHQIELNSGMRYRDAKDTFGTRIETMVKHGWLLKQKNEMVYREKLVEQIDPTYALSASQRDAIEKIKTSKKPTICLLGPTGAGKTEIYLQLAHEVLQQNGQTLILVPEISLTPQMVKRVEDRFGQDVIVYHSRLNDNQRYMQYKRVRDGQPAVVVGTRSAIWLPFTDLRLIVLDEEHDNSYKQDRSPRYHCRDVAIQRAIHFNAKVILGSATPSLDTFARAQKGVYELVELDRRISGTLPEVKFVRPIRNSQLAPEIEAAIAQRLTKKEQILILLNRRGYAPVLQCVDCGFVETCGDCERSFSVHKDENILKCHTCGTSKPLTTICPQCQGHHLRMIGSGTQKVEEELRLKFPDARITRMDSDTTQTKDSHETLLNRFEQHQSDILLGTQMIAKGLDIPNVTLSVILGVDSALLRTDVRSVEEIFALIVQASGRSGRGEGKGEVLVMTQAPEHYALRCAQNHDYRRFFSIEMNYRKIGQNPPYTYLVALEWTATKQESAAQSAAIATLELTESDELNVLGPVDLGKTKGVYRSRVILKGKNLDQMRSKVWKLLENKTLNGDAELSVDVNPFTLL